MSLALIPRDTGGGEVRVSVWFLQIQMLIKFVIFKEIPLCFFSFLVLMSNSDC